MRGAFIFTFFVYFFLLFLDAGSFFLSDFYFYFALVHPLSQHSTRRGGKFKKKVKKKSKEKKNVTPTQHVLMSGGWLFRRGFCGRGKVLDERTKKKTKHKKPIFGKKLNKKQNN